MKILVAEDNIDSRELLTEILQTLGYDVVLAFDGVNALEKIGEGFPDLCISVARSCRYVWRMPQEENHS